MKSRKYLPLWATSIGVILASSVLSSGLAAASTFPKVAPPSPQSPSVTSVTRNDYGINVFSYDSQLNAATTIPALKSLDMGMQQFPNANQWSWASNSFRTGGIAPVSLNDWGNILSQTGNQGLFIFNYDENPTFTGGGSPQDAAVLTQYIVQNHLPINSIVIGSEEYGSWDYSANMNPSYSAQYYAARAAQIAQAIHQVDPAMKVGVSFDLGDGPHSTMWDQTVLRVDGPYINFVSVHDYPNAQLLSNTGLLSTLPNEISGAMQLIHNDITANVPGSLAKNIQIWVTEYNPYGEPGPQSLQSVYGAAMVESAMLWRADGAKRLFFWSYDGQAHSVNTSSNNDWPVATNGSQPYGLFALVGDGNSPELAMNQFYPSAVALSQYMQAIGQGGSLSTWVSPSIIIGQVSHQTTADWFLINETNIPQTASVNSQPITLAPASMTELTNQSLIYQTSLTPSSSQDILNPVHYQSSLPQVSLPSSALYAGESVSISGQYFGSLGSNSRIILRQNGTEYGAPGNAYSVKIIQWTPTTVQFMMPDGQNGGPPLSEGNATLQVETANNVISAKVPITVGAVPALSASSITPQVAAPGTLVTISGSNFGNNQGTGYVMVSQNGINYGGPGNFYRIAITQWSNQQIQFTVPDGTLGPALTDGLASVVVANSEGLTTNPMELSITSSNTGDSVTTAYPGKSITISGGPFGNTRGAGYVMVEQNGIQYGGPGNFYKVTILNWANQSISFIIPNGDSGPALIPGTATVVIANSQGNVVSTTNLAITTAPELPASLSTSTPFAPGQWVTVTGQNFGNNQGNGFVSINQDGVNYGAPDNSFPVAIKTWTNTAITFLVPTHAYPVNGLWERQLVAGQIATVTITTNSGLKTVTLTPIVVSP